MENNPWDFSPCQSQCYYLHPDNMGVVVIWSCTSGCKARLLNKGLWGCHPCIPWLSLQARHWWGGLITKFLTFKPLNKPVKLRGCWKNLRISHRRGRRREGRSACASVWWHHRPWLFKWCLGACLQNNISRKDGSDAFYSLLFFPPSWLTAGSR